MTHPRPNGPIVNVTAGATARTGAGLAPVREQLRNGVVIVAKESRVTPAVTLHASMRAGTIFDPADLGGLSHFVSRTIDRGTPSRSADALAEELDGRGVSLNVSINRHVLSLVCTCLVEDVGPIVSLLADVVRSPVFPPAEVETRRGEIVTLIRQDEDSPASVAAERLMTLLYGASHPYGRPSRGTLESVGRITRDDLLRFHQARFRPDLLTLTMVGDLEPARAIALAESVFGDWAVAASPSLEEPLPAAAPATGRRVEVIPMMGKAQADIAYGFISITRDDPHYVATNLMNNILGQYSIGGRLGDSIRERQGMAYYVFSGLDASVIPGPLMVRAGVNPANVERAVASIDEELARFAAEGPSDEELAESKQYLIGSMPRTLETNAGIASYLQMIEFFGLGLDYDLRLPALLRAVTRDEVHAAAGRLLHSQSASVVVAGPYDGALR